MKTDLPGIFSVRRHHNYIIEFGESQPTTKYLLKDSPKFTKVPWGFYGISDGALASFGFDSCSAIILQNSRKSALAHIFSGENLTEYIDSMIDRLQLPIEDLGASFITYPGGDRYRDTFDEYCDKLKMTHFSPDLDYKFSRRDVVVFPERNEIFVVSDYYLASVNRQQNSMAHGSFENKGLVFVRSEDSKISGQIP